MNSFNTEINRDDAVAAQGQRECVVCGQPLTPEGKCPRPQETLCTMTDEGPEVSSAASPSLVGQHGNPRPSDGPKWEVQVIDQAVGEVCVRYVNADTVDPWWITEQAWHAWKKYEADHAA